MPARELPLQASSWHELLHNCKLSLRCCCRLRPTLSARPPWGRCPGPQLQPRRLRLQPAQGLSERLLGCTAVRCSCAAGAIPCCAVAAVASSCQLIYSRHSSLPGQRVAIFHRRSRLLQRCLQLPCQGGGLSWRSRCCRAAAAAACTNGSRRGSQCSRLRLLS